MTRRKLIVEVVDAHDLMGKDEEGSSSPYVVVDYDEQVRRTRTKHKDLNPVWTEKLEFIVTDPKTMAMKELEAVVYTDKRLEGDRKHEFLGRVKISGRQLVPKGDEALVYFPLEKRNMLSRVKGELGLAIYYIDERTPPTPEEKPAQELVAAVKPSSAEAGPDGYPPGETSHIDVTAATEATVQSANAVPVELSLPEAPPVEAPPPAEEPPAIVSPTEAQTEAPPLAERPPMEISRTEASVEAPSPTEGTPIETLPAEAPDGARPPSEGPPGKVPPAEAPTEAPSPAEGSPMETPPTEAPVQPPPGAEALPVMVPPAEAPREAPPPAEGSPMETPPTEAPVEPPPAAEALPVMVPPAEAPTEAPPPAEGSPMETPPTGAPVQPPPAAEALPVMVPPTEAPTEAPPPAEGSPMETPPTGAPVQPPPAAEALPVMVPPTEAPTEAPPPAEGSPMETPPTEAPVQPPPAAEALPVMVPPTEARTEAPPPTEGSPMETPPTEAPVEPPPPAEALPVIVPPTEAPTEAPPPADGPLVETPHAKASPARAPVKAPLPAAALLVEDPSTEAPIKAPPPTEALRFEAPPVELAPTDGAYMVAAHVEDGLTKASPLVKEKPSGDGPPQGKTRHLQRKPRRKQRSHKKQSSLTKERAGEYLKNDLGGLSSAHDLAEKMQYLFVRIVRARSLPPRDLTTGTLVNPSVKIRIGDEIVKMRTSEKTAYPEWDQIFTFSREKLRSAPSLEISVWDEETGMKGEFLGGVCFDVSVVPTRVPPDGPLAPQWYKLDGNNRVKGDIMLAIWMGTQDVAEFIHGQKYVFMETA